MFLALIIFLRNGQLPNHLAIDSSQISVTNKLDTKHIVCFSLEPISYFSNLLDRWYFRIRPFHGNPNFYIVIISWNADYIEILNYHHQYQYPSGTVRSNSKDSSIFSHDAISNHFLRVELNITLSLGVSLGTLSRSYP